MKQMSIGLMKTLVVMEFCLSLHKESKSENLDSWEGDTSEMDPLVERLFSDIEKETKKYSNQIEPKRWNIQVKRFNKCLTESMDYEGVREYSPSLLAVHMVFAWFFILDKYKKPNPFRQIDPDYERAGKIQELEYDKIPESPRFMHLGVAELTVRKYI